MSDSILHCNAGDWRSTLTVFVEPDENPSAAVREEVAFARLENSHPRVLVVHLTSRRGDELFTRDEFLARHAVNGRKL